MLGLTFRSMRGGSIMVAGKWKADLHSVIPSEISFDTLARAFRRHAGRRPGIHAFLGSSIVRRGWPACAGHDGWDRLCRPIRTSGACYELATESIAYRHAQL